MTGERQPAKPSTRGPSRVIDQPRAGFFLIKLVKGGPRVPARICVDFDQFWAEINGKAVGAATEDPLTADHVMRIWHYGVEIDEQEHRRLLARENAPDPSTPIDLRRKPSLF